MTNHEYLTPDGLKRLEAELDHLKTVRRSEVAQRLHEAMAEGEIEENPEYDDAKNEQAFVEGRILQIETVLSNAVLIEHSLAKGADKEVRLGSYEMFHRGEPLNATWFVLAAVCCYLVAYRFYSAFIAARLLTLDDTRATPAERHDDGRDFVPTNKWILFGHHFAAIAGPGPLVGPTLAAQFGYLPGTLWLIAGAVFAVATRSGRSHVRAASSRSCAVPGPVNVTAVAVK